MPSSQVDRLKLLVLSIVVFASLAGCSSHAGVSINGASSGAMVSQSDSNGRMGSLQFTNDAGVLIIAAQSCVEKQGQAADRCEDAIVAGLRQLDPVEQFMAAQAIFSFYPCYGKAENKRKFTEVEIEAGRLLGNFDIVAMAHYSRGMCYWNGNDFSNAFELMKPLVNTVTKYAVVAPGESDEELLQETAALLPVWRNLVRFAENTYRVRPEICRRAGPDFCQEMAWQIMEKIKGRMFRLSATRSAVRGTGGAALMEKLTEQKALLIARESNRLGLSGFDPRQALPPAVIESRLAALGSEIIAAAPSLAVASGLQDPTLDDIRRLLQPGESYVSFLTVLDERKPVVVQIRKEGAPILRLVGENASVIRELVETYRGALARKDAARVDAVGQRLSRALLGPVELSGVRRLLLSVDGNLAGVPFGLLPHQGRPLGERLTVGYVPSAGFFRQLRTTTRGAGHTVPYVGFARENYASRLPSLNGANDEIRNAGLAMEEGGPIGRAVMVTDAGKADVFRRSTAIADARVLHFATHAVEQGGFLGLDFGDGRLEGYEIVQGLNSRAELAILSACSTAPSNAQLSEQGEAFSDLARAFFAIGTRRLLVTQWPVDTVATRILITQFLQRLRDSDADSALAGAQQALRELQPDFASAYFWGSFILMGD